MRSYNRFAYIYDQLMDHAPYKKWIQFTLEQIKLKKRDVRTIVDLGCGTGVIPVHLAQLGYDVTGIDYSPDMLTAAAERAMNRNVQVNWIQQDIRKLEGFNQIDLFISYCDVMNYITEQEDLISVFERVYNSLTLDGLFIFDIHSIYYAKGSLINETFSDVTEEIVYIWECEQGSRPGEMFHHLTFFQKEGDQYSRFDELHHQQTYEIDVYKQLLKSSGFNKIEFYGDFLIENNFSEKNSERIFVVAQK